MKAKSLSRVRLFVTHGLWPTVAYKASPSMGFSRQGYWSGLLFPSPRDLPDPGIEPRFPALQADALPSEPREAPREDNKTSVTVKDSIWLNRICSSVSPYSSKQLFCHQRSCLTIKRKSRVTIIIIIIVIIIIVIIILIVLWLTICQVRWLETDILESNVKWD